MDTYSLVFGFIAGALLAGAPCLLYALERAAAAARARQDADIAGQSLADAVDLAEYWRRLYREATGDRR